MTQLTTPGISPFDILFKNFFERDFDFAPFDQIKFNFPVDIYEADNALNIDITCTGLTKTDINLTVEGDVLRVEYKKGKDEAQLEYIRRNIAKRAFNLGWRVSRKFDLNNLKAKLENGLLQISIPKTEESKTQTIEIQ